MSLPPHLMHLQAKLGASASQNHNVNTNVNKISSVSNINTSVSTKSNPQQTSSKRREKVISGKKESKGKVENKIEKRVRKLKKSKIMKKKWKVVRKAGGEVWEDPTLEEWPENDFRIFCGDLGNEVSDEILANAFRKYSSFQKARVIRDKKTGKSKGYGFVSFKESGDYIKAMREMNGKYVGNRPIRLKKSNWKDRCLVYNNSKVETVKFKRNNNKIRKRLMNNANSNLNPYINPEMASYYPVQNYDNYTSYNMAQNMTPVQPTIHSNQTMMNQQNQSIPFDYSSNIYQ